MLPFSGTFSTDFRLQLLFLCREEARFFMSFPSSPLPSSHASDSNSASHSPDAVAPPQSVADNQAASAVSTSVESVLDAAAAPILTPVEPLAPNEPLAPKVIVSTATALPATALPAIERRAGRAAAWQASVPAVLLFALGAAANQAPLSKPLPLAQVERVSSAVAAGVVAPGETMIVSAKNVSGSSILRGRLQFAGGVSGRAPLSGAISRVLVREGQFVQVNDRVLQIATSTGSRRVRRVERVQSSAESAQVRAVNAQAALQSRLAGAQSRLEAARLRVARAGARVAQAQEIVQKLQRGETVAIPDTANASADRVSSRRESPSRRARRRSARRLERRESASRVVHRRDSGASREALSRALRESKSAMRASDAAQSEVESARRAAEEAGNAVGAKTQQAAEARAAVESAQKRLADGTGKEADVEAAKAAGAAAEADADAARARVADARKTVAAKENAASSARAAADQAASEAARADRKLELFSSQSDAPRGESASKEEAQDAKTSGDEDERVAQGEVDAGVSPVARAARLVEAALQESSEAIREARRLKADVEKYDRQVKATNHRLDTTGRDLEAAQQTVLDDTIQTRLSSVRAPSSGTVLSIASLAEEVGEGETIITIGRSSSLRVRFADYSGVWKTLKPGALLTASVQPALDQSSAAPVVRFRSGANRTATRARAASARRALPNAAKRGKSGTSGAIPVSGKVPVKKVANSGGVAIVARLRAVEAPRRPGQPAIMEAVIFNPRRLVATPSGLRRRRIFRPGMAILCSIDKPGKRRVISVPSGAIVRDAPDGNRGWIAVLTPAPAPAPALVPPAHDDAAVAPGPSASAVEAVAPGLVTSDDASDDVSPGSDSAPTETLGAQRETSTETPQGIDHGSWLRIELRRVVLGPGDGVQQEIANGLREGERIALRPAALRALTARFGSRAAVRLQPEDERAPGA